jgi:phosphate transport system substrate-binding protein
MAANEVKFKLNRLTAIGTAVMTAATIGLSVSAVKSQSPATIKIDGSSTVFPITEAVAEEFQKVKKRRSKSYSWRFWYWRRLQKVLFWRDRYF